VDPESYSIVKDRSQKTCLFRAGGPEGPFAFGCPVGRGVAPRRTGETLVELIGIEPTTSGLQSPRSPS
jgi:hypothetical protein